MQLRDGICAAGLAIWLFNVGCDGEPAVQPPAVAVDAEVDAALQPDAMPVPDVTVDAVQPPPDVEGPAWPARADLTVVRLEAHRVILSWPNATDLGGVVRYEVRQDDVVVETVEGDLTAVEIAGLAPGVDYLFRVSAVDPSDNVSVNDPFVAVTTPDERGPIWPDGSVLTAAEITDSSLTLGWTAASDDVGVTGYRLYRDNIELDTTDAEVTDYAVTGLDATVSYTFRVEAEDAAGNRSFGGPWTRVELLDVEAPEWPPNGRIEASRITASGLTLGWTPATDNVGVVQYAVYQGGVALGVTQPPVTWLAVDDLAPWRDYTFTVTATDGAGNTSEAALSVSASTPDDSTPTWPAGAAIAVSDPQVTQITLGWSAAEDDVGVSGYRVYQDLVRVAELGPDERDWTAVGLSQAFAYLFSVQAVDAAGNESRDGPELRVRLNDQSPPVWPAVGTLTVSDVGATSVRLVWPAATDDIGVAAYPVWANDQLVRTVDGATTDIVLEGLLPNTDYVFSVTASDAAGNEAAMALTAAATTLDLPPPAWPVDSVLTPERVDVDAVVLSWAPVPEESVQFTVWQDGQLVETVDAPLNRAAIGGLESATEYRFQVQAVGPTGLSSADGPVADVTTLDGDAPTWPADAILSVQAVGPTHVTLGWSAAEDGVAVTEYVVYDADGQVAATTAGNILTARLDELAPETDYVFRVEARDAAGNESVGGPVVNATTERAPPMGPTTAEVFAGLGPSCGPCHAAGAQERIAYFASEQAFSQLIATNGAYVQPGNPDGSLLVQLLEGTAEGVWTQMPLPPSPPFSQMPDVQITMADIRLWIVGL